MLFRSATTAFVQAALSAIYPVGSIYTNASVSTNPGTLLGFGTWTAFGTGRVLVGVDSGNTAFDTLGETGGSADAVVVSHTHTATFTGSALPTHTHTLPGIYNGASGSIGGNALSTQYGSGPYTSSATSAGTPSGTVSVSTDGSSATNANLQPYITVYMWKRTA